jgi:hypothetical protein
MSCTVVTYGGAGPGTIAPSIVCVKNFLAGRLNASAMALLHVGFKTVVHRVLQSAAESAGGEPVDDRQARDESTVDRARAHRSQ